MDRRASAALHVAAAVGVVYLALVLAALAGAGGDARWFLHFGEEKESLPLARERLGDDLPLPFEDGHDGAYFWALARDPLLLDAATLQRSLDRPTYRAQRLGYPLLVAPWRLAGEMGVVWGMLVVNLAAVVVGTWAAAALARRVGGPAWAGLAFAANPAVLVSVFLDFADALAIALVVVAALALFDRRVTLAAGAAIGAALTKEPMLLSIVPLALLVPGLRRHERLLVVAAPTSAALAWFGYVHLRLDPSAREVREVTAPGVGYVDVVRHDDPATIAVAVALLVFAALSAALAWRWRRLGGPGLLVLASLPWALLVPLLTRDVLGLAHNAVRAVGPAVTLVGIAYLVGRAPLAIDSQTAAT